MVCSGGKTRGGSYNFGCTVIGGEAVAPGCLGINHLGRIVNIGEFQTQSHSDGISHRVVDKVGAAAAGNPVSIILGVGEAACGKHRHLSGAVIAALILHKTGDYTLVGIVAAGIRTGTAAVRIERVEHEVAVLIATPAPVEMEEIVAEITVAHEGMTSHRGATGIIHRTIGLKFGIYHVVPFLESMVVTPFHLDRLVISEVSIQGHRHIVAVSTALVRRIHHAHRGSALTHQLGNRGSLCRAVLSGFVIVKHIRPVKGSAAEHIPGIRACRIYGPLIVTHHLGHSCGYTACHTATSRS